MTELPQNIKDFSKEFTNELGVLVDKYTKRGKDFKICTHGVKKIMQMTFMLLSGMDNVNVRIIRVKQKTPTGIPCKRVNCDHKHI